MVPVPSASGRFTSGPLPSHPPPRRKGRLAAQEVALRLIRSITVASAVLGLLAADAGAGEQAASRKVTFTLARHHTTNALDGPLALADWYTELRGALEHTVAHDLGSTRLTADMELRRFDTYDIEDDAAFGIGAETTIRASDTLELRGTMSVRTISDGDDIAVEDLIIGTRTRKTVLAGAFQAGRLLAPDTVLVLEAAAAREFAGRTHFQDGLLPATPLDADRDRLRLGATLTRTQGPVSYGASVTTGLRRTHALDPLPELLLLEHAARLHGSHTFRSEAYISGAIGFEMLQLADSGFSEIRPTFEVTAATPLPAGFSLRGVLRAGYDTTSTDDPLAVRVRRAEAELGFRASPAVTLSTGIFDERRDNLAIGNREMLRGVYGEVAWQANEDTSLALRVDLKRHLISVYDIEKRTVDVQIAATRKL